MQPQGASAIPKKGSMATVSNVGLFLFLWYIAVLTASMVNYIVWLRFETEMLGKAHKRTYLSFLVLGYIFFGTFAATFMIKAVKYARDHKEQRNDLMVGIAFVYFPFSLPIFILELHQVYEFGFHSSSQALSFLMNTLSWFLGSTLVWFGYIWRMSKLLEERFYPLSGVQSRNARQGGGGFGVMPLLAPSGQPLI